MGCLCVCLSAWSGVVFWSFFTAVKAFVVVGCGSLIVLYRIGIRVGRSGARCRGRSGRSRGGGINKCKRVQLI